MFYNEAMKKFVLFFASLFLLPFIFPLSSASAETEKTYFAKVPTSGVYFCSSPSLETALFEIPPTYFVQVQAVKDDFFEVKYRDLSGFVKKSDVKLMNGTPIEAFDNTSYSVYLPFSLYQNTNAATEIALLTPSMVLTYYGKKVGQQMKPNLADWYYSGVLIDGVLLRGYVYSDHATMQISTGKNEETFPPLSEDALVSGTTTAFSGLSTGTKIILIVAISVPSLLILYFLIKPSKIMQITKSKRKPKSISKRIRHGDYFEFDENEL